MYSPPEVATIVAVGANQSYPMLQTDGRLTHGIVRMDASSFTQRTRRVLVNAQHEAKQLGHAEVGSAHVLLALLQEGNGVVNAVLDNLRVNFTEVRERVRGLAPPVRRMGLLFRKHV